MFSEGKHTIPAGRMGLDRLWKYKSHSGWISFTCNQWIFNSWRLYKKVKSQQYIFNRQQCYRKKKNAKARVGTKISRQIEVLSFIPGLVILVVKEPGAIHIEGQELFCMHFTSVPGVKMGRELLKHILWATETAKSVTYIIFCSLCCLQTTHWKK